MSKFKQLVLIVLDGFGIASPSDGNAIYLANPRNINYLINNFPATALQASGPAVGLPWGERGNSEVGHLNLGAGRVVSQDLPRINHAISQGDFFKNPALLGAIAHVRKNRSRLHLVGLLSDGGVHSSEEHVYALLGLAAEERIEKVFVHMFTDGRDTAPKVALGSLDRLYRKFLEYGVGALASVTGRFYAMDRGGHWEVTESAYNALVGGVGETTNSPRAIIEEYYHRQIFDETIPPTVVANEQGPVGKIDDGDSVIFFNFRPDRMVQLARAFADPAFDKFSKGRRFLQNVNFVSMTLYEKGLPTEVAFPPAIIGNGLAEVLSRANLPQYHISESEKYAHVTSFFNGGSEQPWPGEEREIITSPQAYEQRYADVPEMSADKLGQRIVARLRAGTAFILANFANPDMVGHTANPKACIAAVRAVDRNLAVVFEAVQAAAAALVVTSDHGNIEQILDLRTGSIDKEHTLNPVPLIVAGRGLNRRQVLRNGYLELASIVPEGVLSDVAPTVLDLMGLQKPEEMTAVSLLPFLLRETREGQA